MNRSSLSAGIAFAILLGSAPAFAAPFDDYRILPPRTNSVVLQPRYADDIDALNRNGYLYVENLTNLLTAHPDSVEIYYRIAVYYHEHGDRTNARAYYLKTIAGKSYFRDSAYFRMMACNNLSDVDSQLNRKYEALSNAVQSVELLKKMTNYYGPLETALPYVTLGERFFELTNVRQARAAYDTACSVTPLILPSDDWIDYASLYFRDDPRKCLALLDQADGYSAMNPSIYYARFWVRLLSGDLLGAYDEAIFGNYAAQDNAEISPQFVRAVFGFPSITNLPPQLRTFTSNFNDLLIASTEADPSNGNAGIEQGFLQAIRTYTNFTAAYFELANYYYATGDLKKAVPCLQTVIRLRPTFFGAYSNLYRIYKTLADRAGMNSIQSSYYRLQYSIPMDNYSGAVLHPIRIVPER